MGISWKCYEEGDFEDAGLVILKLLVRSNQQKETRYLVRYTCCGREEERDHYQIHERARRYAEKCRFCAREGPKFFGIRNGISYDYDSVVPPSWPVPRIEE